MRKKLLAFCSVIAVVSLVLTAYCVKSDGEYLKTDVSYAEREQYYDEAADMNTTVQSNASNEVTSSGSSSGGLLGGSGGFLENLGGGSGIGGIGEIFGDASDIIGGVIGDPSNGSSGNSSTTSSMGNPIYIDPVPAATYVQSGLTSAPAVTNPITSMGSTAPVAETVNPAAASNPYMKPTGEIKEGDMGDGVKWMQWMFIYTGYGLQGKQVTGVYDAETVEVVKKLQTEKGLTADGVVNDAVIDKIELLYFEHKYNVETTTVPASDNLVTAPETIEATEADGNGGKPLKIAITIAVIAAIWCIAIVVIVLIVILKKSKNKKAGEVTENKTAPAGDAKPAEPEKKEMTLSDLFEEANEKK